MRRWRPMLCALCLALLVPLLLRAWRVLPLDTRPLVARKYAGWTGVLRLWTFEGWETGGGSLAPWLNRCVERFEKRHPGVYIQPRTVDAGAVASINESGILPPDMLLFPPGLLDSPEGLSALDAPGALRPGLERCGAWGGRVCAVPVAMGGYAWAWNPSLTDAVPRDWSDGGATLAAPPPDAWHRWDIALLALCGGALPDNARREPIPGVDLGLMLSGASALSPSPAPAADGGETCHLPAGFAFDDTAWARFINGEAAAMPVTQREVRRLAALDGQGRGPDWRLAPGGGAFTDQLSYLALVDRPDAGERRALCLEFMGWLLEDESQGELWKAGAFSVTDAPSGYPPGDPLLVIEAALRDDALAAAPAFGRGWSEAAEGIVRKFTSGQGDTPSLWRSLAQIIAQNPNNNPR